MGWFAPVLVGVTVLVSLRSCWGLDKEAAALHASIERRHLVALATASERLLCYNEWVGATSQLRAQARMLPAALGRVCSMLGVGLGVFQAATALENADWQSALPAAVSVAFGLLGWGLCLRRGAHVRARIDLLAAELRKLRRLFDPPAEPS